MRGILGIWDRENSNLVAGVHYAIIPNDRTWVWAGKYLSTDQDTMLGEGLQIAIMVGLFVTNSLYLFLKLSGDRIVRWHFGDSTLGGIYSKETMRTLQESEIPPNDLLELRRKIAGMEKSAEFKAIFPNGLDKNLR
jgi:hypothetical protein